MMTTPVIHIEDTPIKVLAPGNGRIGLGRLWPIWPMSDLGAATGL
jgi:hypothetical protein